VPGIVHTETDTGAASVEAWLELEDRDGRESVALKIALCGSPN